MDGRQPAAVRRRRFSVSRCPVRLPDDIIKMNEHEVATLTPA
jgi:hypothetical protein